MNKCSITSLYLKARELLLATSYANEIAVVEGRRFEDQTPETFLTQYTYVVLNVGLRNQVAERIMQRLVSSGFDVKTIKHTAKRKAIIEAKAHYIQWFRDLKSAHDKLSFLETLPFIGPVTKYHLGRNLGLDMIKPDRHLAKLAKEYQFKDAHEMCGVIGSRTGHRVGTVDVIMWRACNLHLIERLTRSI